MLNDRVTQKLLEMGASVTPTEDGSTIVHVPGASHRYRFGPTGVIEQGNPDSTEFHRTWYNEDQLLDMEAAHHFLNNAEEFPHELHEFEHSLITNLAHNRQQVQVPGGPDVSVYQETLYHEPEDRYSTRRVVGLHNRIHHFLDTDHDNLDHLLSETGHTLATDFLNNPNEYHPLIDYLQENHPTVWNYVTRQNFARIYSRLIRNQ